MAEHNKIDRGVIFTFDNIERAIIATKSNDSFAYLYRVIKREKYQLQDITKTGDLIRYFEGFSDGNHHHAKEFLDLSVASDNSFYPFEKMADELRKRFPDEVGHCTNVNDFVVGECYSNGFLSVVLGGSYALSFRLTRNPEFAYIMMNSLVTDPNTNVWSDNYNSLLFTPPGRFYGDQDGIRRIIEKHGNKTVLVFDKISSDGFTFFGQYHLKSIVDNKALLIRDSRIRDDKISHFDFNGERNIKSLLDTDDIIPQIVIADILIQKAVENGIDFSLQKAENNSFTIEFPFGFFELIGNFSPFRLIVSSSYRFVGGRGNILTYTVSTKRYKTGNGVTGWSIFEEEIKNYHKLYYKLFSESSPNMTWVNKGPLIKGGDTNKTHPYLVNFVISSIAADLENESSNSSPVYYKWDAKNNSKVSQLSGIAFDLVIDAYYSRIGIESPIFVIKRTLNKKKVEAHLHKVSSDIASRLVFITFSKEKTTYESFNGSNYLVLGTAFISQLARLFPSIYAQFVIPEDNTTNSSSSTSIKQIPNDGVIRAGQNYSEALKNNIAYFQNLIKGNKQISIITGNGVSIPFGSESWSELAKNLLNQLKPRFIESVDEIDQFFGGLSFFTTDFSYDTLRLKKEEPLYWRTLSYSIYRRFSETMYEEKTAIKSIATIKKNFGRRIKLYTYNYDTFLEGQYSHDYHTKTLNPVLKPTKSSDEVIHLHGIIRPTDAVGNGVILTRSEYYDIYRDYEKSKAMLSFVESLRNNICLFIGSSMTDMFQMMLIDKVCQSSGNKSLIYAILPIDRLQEGAKETIYQYFLEKHIFVIPYKDFKELPETVLELFGLS